MPVSTHDVSIGPERVVKRFRSWDRGEPDREWRALELLQRYAPGLAATPLSRGREDGRPVIVMTRLPGASLGRTPLTQEQTTALAAAIDRLHGAVPQQQLARLPRRLWSASEAVSLLRRQVEQAPGAVDAAVRTAWDDGAAWLASSAATRFAAEEPPRVFSQADGNLGNAVWDGRACGLVDFEDSGVSDRAFEIADLVEHVSGRLTSALDADALIDALDLDTRSRSRLRQARRLLALYWLLRLMPGSPAHHRNPPGSLESQALWLRTLLG